MRENFPKKENTHPYRNTQNLNHTRPEKKLPKAYHNQHTKYTGKKEWKLLCYITQGPKEIFADLLQRETSAVIECYQIQKLDK